MSHWTTADVAPRESATGCRQVAATHVRYFVLAWLCAASLIAYMDRGCIAVAERSIREDLALSPDAMSNLLGAFFLTYSILQIPAAALAKRWGTRIALSLYSAVWSVATGLCGLAIGYPDLLMYRLGMGAAEAGIFPCATTALGQWFPRTRRAWVCGLLTAFQGVGGTVGGLLSGPLVVYLSWRWMFLLYTIPGVAWAAGFFWWFRDTPRQHRGVNDAELAVIEDGEQPAPAKDDDACGQPVPWGAMASSPSLWLLGLQQFFRSMGLAFFMTYYPTFLQTGRGAALITAGAYNGLAYAALVAGSILGGLIADWILVRTGSRTLSRKGFGMACTFGGALLVIAAFFVESLELTALLVSTGTLVVSLANSCGYALTIDLGGKSVAPVFAVVNTLANFGYVLFPKLATALLERTGQNWNAVLLLVSAAFLAATLCWVLLNPYANVTGDSGAGKASDG